MPSPSPRIVLTTAPEQAAELRHHLTARGAVGLLLPCVAEARLHPNPPLGAALRVISQYQWIVLSGAAGVAAFWEPLLALGLDERVLKTQRFGVVGRAAARALTRHGPLAEFVIDEADAPALTRIGPPGGQWVLVVHAAEYREPLALALAEHGAVVREVAGFRTRPAALAAEALAEVRAGVDAIALNSPAAAVNFAALAGAAAIGAARVICRGPATAQAARAAGLPVHGVAAAPTAEALAAACLGGQDD